MTPKKNVCGQILGGSASFVGEIESMQVVLMQNREQKTCKLPRNQHKVGSPARARFSRLIQNSCLFLWFAAAS